MLPRIELGRIAGIEINLDLMFVLVLLLFTYPYFTTGNTQMMSAGFIIIVGLLLSILLHELGHAFAGRLFKARVSHIDLTGLGGVAHFERSLPASVIARSVIYLAGRRSTGSGSGQALTGEAAGMGKPMLAMPIAVLASINFVLMCFNLLPAYPLDGGHTLDAGSRCWGRCGRCASLPLGLVVAIGLALYALPTGIFMLFVALFLAQANWEALQSVRGSRWR
jgi:Zn-dependent protease